MDVLEWSIAFCIKVNLCYTYKYEYVDLPNFTFVNAKRISACAS